MADVVAVMHSVPTLLSCQLRRLDSAVEMNATAGDVLGVGYYENGRVLLRKGPVPQPIPTLSDAAKGIATELLLECWHHAGANGFREADTAPYRFRNWLFASKGKMLAETEQAEVAARLPDFLQRGLGQTSTHEIAFFAALAHIHAESKQLDHLEIDPEVVGHALGRTLAQLDERAAHAGTAPSQTTMVLSNGRMIVAARRGRPLFYALLEGMGECAECGVDRDTSDRDPRVRAHRTMKSVVLTTRAKKNGVQWIEVPDGHVLTVNRTLGVRVSPLAR